MASDNSPPLLLLDNVCKSRASEGQKIDILKNICLNLEEGKLSVVIGPSGGGKSTLLRLLNRLEEPTSGQILFRGEMLAEIAPTSLRREVAMIMQKPFMFEGSVLDNLHKPFHIRKGEIPDAEGSLLKRTLEQCHLEKSLLNRRAVSLSVGQQQRVSLARALMTEPKVLLLDEPTSALDRPTGDLLARTILSLCSETGVTVIMATHDLRMAEQVADDLIYLEAGKVVEQGKGTTLLNSPQSELLKQFLAEPDFSIRESAVVEKSL